MLLDYMYQTVKRHSKNHKPTICPIGTDVASVVRSKKAVRLYFMDAFLMSWHATARAVYTIMEIMCHW